MDRVPIQIPSWTEFFIGLAFAVSQRSPDGETKHGCVIVNKHKHILGVGFNGFPRGANDAVLPNLRPNKYRWMYHSERNALANCETKPWNGTAYVTGRCCNDCLYELHQHGIIRVNIADKHGSHIIKQEDLDWQTDFCKQTGLELVFVKPDLSWLNVLGKKVTEENFWNPQMV